MESGGERERERGHGGRQGMWDESQAGREERKNVCLDTDTDRKRKKEITQ